MARKRMQAAAKGNQSLLKDIRQLIEETRSAVAATVNAGLTMLYWQIGKRINDEILNGKRAGYGEEIVSTLSRQLTLEYGSGFLQRNLNSMVQITEGFPAPEIVQLLFSDKGEK